MGPGGNAKNEGFDAKMTIKLSFSENFRGVLQYVTLGRYHKGRISSYHELLMMNWGLARHGHFGSKIVRCDS